MLAPALQNFVHTGHPVKRQERIPPETLAPSQSVTIALGSGSGNGVRCTTGSTASHLDSIFSPKTLSSTGEAPCGAHVFEGFFGLENGPVKSDKSQEKTLFGKDFP